MKRKTLALILSLALALGALSGCGSSDAGQAAVTGNSAGTDSETPAPAAETAQQPQAEDGDGEDIELSLLFWSDGRQKELVEQACRNYEKMTGIKINEEVLPSDESFDTYIQTRKESGTLPDLSYINEADVMKYNEMGLLAPIDDLFESGAIPEKLDSVTVKDTNGKVVAVGLSNQLMLLYYNKDMFDEAGIPYPSTDVASVWTWDEFIEVCQKLTTDVNGKTAAQDGFDSSKIQTYGVGFNCLMAFHQFWPMYANGGGLVSADGKEFLWDKPETIEGLQNVVDLINKYHVASPAGYTFVSSIGGVDAAIGGGGYAMYINGSWDLGNIPNIEGTNVGVAVLPKMKEAVTMNCGAPLVVYNTSKHLEAAKDFYAYMIDPANSIELLQSGAWLPNQADYYTDQALIGEWTKDLPKDAVETIMSYVSHEGSIAQWPAYYLPPYNKMNAEYTKYIDQALNGEKSVEEVYAECMPEIKRLYETGTVE